MAATTLAQINYVLKEYWSTKKGGGPLGMWSRSGDLWKIMKKSFTKGSFEGNGIAKIPVDSILPANGGPNYELAYANASEGSGFTFEVFKAENWQQMRLKGDLIEFGTANSIVGGKGSVMHLSEMNTAAAHRVMSYLIWSDGTGRIAKGDDAYLVTGDTITFKNANSVSQFELKDLVVLIDPAAPLGANGMPVPRAGSLEVIAVGEDSIQLNANVNTIVGANNSDFVSKLSFFAGNSPVFNGIFSWLPITATEAATTKYGVDRSQNVKRLAGSRVLVDANMSAYQIIAKMGVALKKSIGSVPSDADYALFMPADGIEDLMADAAARGIEFHDVTSTSDASQMCIGTSAYKVVFPTLRTKPIMVYTDHFLHDPQVSAEDDRTYVLLDMSNFRVDTSREGFGWRDLEGTGSYIKKINGEDEYYGSYGVRGALMCHDPAHNVVASTRANL